VTRAALALVGLVAACTADMKPPEPTTVANEAPAAKEDPPSVERGAQVFEKHGCHLCHTIDGTPKIGPSMKGLYARIRAREIEFTDGTRIDDPPGVYIREQLSRPNARVVKGYPASEPSFEGQIRDRDMASLLLYLETL
jgi:cytochrome c oxidase subunit 2